MQIDVEVWLTLIPVNLIALVSMLEIQPQFTQLQEFGFDRKKYLEYVKQNSDQVEDQKKRQPLRYALFFVVYIVFLIFSVLVHNITLIFVACCSYLVLFPLISSIKRFQCWRAQAVKISEQAKPRFCRLYVAYAIISILYVTIIFMGSILIIVFVDFFTTKAFGFREISIRWEVFIVPVIFQEDAIREKRTRLVYWAALLMSPLERIFARKDRLMS